MTELEDNTVLLNEMSELNVDARFGKQRQVSPMHPGCFSRHLP
jgi:hypothetical protein